MDGSQLGELQFESFNAAAAKVTCHGVNVHPGSAKNAMINAISLGQQFNSLLPPSEVPERTEGYEGFYHLMNFEGNVEKATLQYIIRDHDKKQFDLRKNVLWKYVMISIHILKIIQSKSTLKTNIIIWLKKSNLISIL